MNRKENQNAEQIAPTAPGEPVISRPVTLDFITAVRVEMCGRPFITRAASCDLAVARWSEALATHQANPHHSLRTGR
jgi:hypothetical protein